jgi:eukaryotic-like serine/threonine-protein kinase
LAPDVSEFVCKVEMPVPSPTPYRFDEFELDPLKRLLLCRGQPVTLQPKALDLLLVLVENHGRLLKKDDLLRLVWPDQIVEESNLTVHISALRKALGEHRGEHRFVVTETGRGYRFVAEVTVVDRDSSGSVAVGEQQAPDHEEGGVARFGRRRAAALVAGLALTTVAGLLTFNLDRSQSGPSPAVAAIPGSQPSLTRLTNGGNVTAAAISPDGKHFAYTTTEPAGQSLWIRQVAGGRSILIATAEAVEYWGLTFSPDGAHIYASVFEPNRAHTQLRRMPALGGRVETLGLSPLSAVAFSPDGLRFAFVQTNAADAESLLKVADADGANVRVLARRRQPAYFDFPGPTVSWSPDGRVIAAVVLNTDEGGDYMTVTGVLVDGSGETSLTTERWAGVNEAAWTLDGTLVVVAHRRALTPAQIWLIAGPETAARQLTSDLNAYAAISITADATTLLLVQRSTVSGLWVQKQGALSDEGRQIRSEVGGFGEPTWTADDRLVYRSTDGGAADLWIVDADGTNPTQLTSGARAGQGLSTSPDGRSLVFASTRGGKENLWRYQVAGGNFTQLTDGDSEISPRVTPDSREVIYQQGAGPGRPTLWRVPLEGGEPSPLVSTHAIRPDLSPDGRLVAYFYMELQPHGEPQWRLGVTSLASGALVKSFAIPATAMPRVVRFTPDGAALAYIDTVGGVGNLWEQPLSDDPPRRITAFDQGALETFAYSRDGRLVAMTRATRISDVAVSLLPQ